MLNKIHILYKGLIKDFVRTCKDSKDLQGLIRIVFILKTSLHILYKDCIGLYRTVKDYTGQIQYLYKDFIRMHLANKFAMKIAFGECQYE